MKHSLPFVTTRPDRLRRLFLLVLPLTVGLAACAPQPRPSGINDPGETQNRRVHAFNTALDRAILKPASHSYMKVTPNPIARGASNLAANLSLPGVIANDLLQLKLGDATSNTLRLALNSTFGIAGLIDVASQNGLAQRDTDFGQTLQVWGVGEGAYVELPILGPSTQRDALGTVVDFAADPLRRLLTGPRRYISPVAHALKKLEDRDTYASTVDSILYDSADSYAQARLLYLQSRRSKLYGGVSAADLEDPYAQ